MGPLVTREIVVKRLITVRFCSRSPAALNSPTSGSVCAIKTPGAKTCPTSTRVASWLLAKGHPRRNALKRLVFRWHRFSLSLICSPDFFSTSSKLHWPLACPAKLLKKPSGPGSYSPSEPSRRRRHISGKNGWIFDQACEGHEATLMVC